MNWSKITVWDADTRKHIVTGSRVYPIAVAMSVTTGDLAARCLDHLEKAIRMSEPGGLAIDIGGYTFLVEA